MPIARRAEELFFQDLSLGMTGHRTVTLFHVDKFCILAVNSTANDRGEDATSEKRLCLSGMLDLRTAKLQCAESLSPRDQSPQDKHSHWFGLKIKYLRISIRCSNGKGLFVRDTSFVRHVAASNWE